MMIRRLLLLLMTIWGILIGAHLQLPSSPSIVVTAREVLIPVQVQYSETYNGGEAMVKAINGLTVKDFQVFEDDHRVDIVGMRTRRYPFWEVRDLSGKHCVDSLVSAQWDGLPIPERFSAWCPGDADVYYISIRPNSRANGSCHKLKVKVDQQAKVYARTEFCDTGTLLDPLGGTSIGQKLQLKANSNDPLNIYLTGQAVAFSAGNKNVVQLTLHFPWKPFELERKGTDFYSRTYVAATAFGEDGTPVERFSDPGPCSWIKCSFLFPDRERLIDDEEYILTSQSYTKQIDLPPGRYTLKAAITNGEDFGRVVLPITVSLISPDNLQISSVVLCKQFHRPENARGEEERRPAEFVPLMSDGVEFTPTGDTRFSHGDRLLVWLQIHPPSNSSPHPLQFRMTVANTLSGHTEADTGPQMVTPPADIAGAANGITREVKIDTLPPGTYRIDVQVTDPKGAATATNSATFVVQ